MLPSTRSAGGKGGLDGSVDPRRRIRRAHRQRLGRPSPTLARRTLGDGTSNGVVGLPRVAFWDTLRSIVILTSFA
jgi:hypothetical protein